MKFRLIPPGEFTMGVTIAEAEAWENMVPYTAHGHMAVPAHLVRLPRPFYLGEPRGALPRFPRNHELQAGGRAE